MGEIRKAARSHIGTKRSATDSSGGPTLLPIFKSPPFDGHRVRNPYVAPGDTNFPGLDTYGWGVSRNGVATCLNLWMCGDFGLKDPQDWDTLWYYGSTKDDAELALNDPATGHASLLGRAIVRIRLDPPGFVPDARVWNVQVNSSADTIVHGMTGTLVLKQTIDELTEPVRNSVYSIRKPWPDFEKHSWDTK